MSLTFISCIAASLMLKGAALFSSDAEVVVHSDGSLSQVVKHAMRHMHGTPRIYSCGEVAEKYYNVKHNVYAVCKDIESRHGHAQCCESVLGPNGCCKDAEACTIEEVYNALGMHCRKGSNSDEDVPDHKLTCKGVRIQYYRKAHDINDLCTDLKHFGSFPKCCATKGCCSDKNECTLDEVFKALQMPCQAIPPATTPAPPVTCADVKRKYDHDDHDVSVICADMKANNANPQCCAQASCCADPSKCTVEEVYQALDMKCDEPPAAHSIVRSDLRTCSKVREKFNDALHDIEDVCQTMKDNQLNPPCCRTFSCCATPICTLEDIFQALSMTC